MDSIISLAQKNTLDEYMILFVADNRPPMLDKDLYDSWKSIMELNIQNREHGRRILELVEHGPLIWPTVKENRVFRTKKYDKLFAAEKTQVDRSLLQIISSDVPLIQETKPLFKTTGLQCNKFRGDNDKTILVLLIRVMLLIQREILQVDRKGYKEKAMLAKAQEARQMLDGEKLAFLVDLGIPSSQAQTIIPHNAAFQTEDLDTYDSDCDDLSTA
nr:hypothetical protein [Tanacetum cinerariifolium]